MNTARTLLCLTLFSALAACHRTGIGTRQAEPDGRNAETIRPAELPLPAIPDSIAAPERRADYLMAHFWDAMDFSDERARTDTLFLEQNFVNFIQLYGYGSPRGAREATRILLERARADETAFRLLCDIAERYLNDPNSPMRDEERYILFLEELLRTPGLPEYDRLRPSWQLETAKKNRPGMTAADFAYVTRSGIRQRLHGTPGERLLLLFYDPDCEHCREILEQLHESRLLRQLLEAGKLAVLAVYTGGDRKLWDATKEAMPQKWSVGFDLDGIPDRELYSLPAMPILYLLDRDKTVLLKDPSPLLLESYLFRNPLPDTAPAE